ncbi:hypothetical protein OSB04_019726 [Centaurea solstitialis]|uniref:Uncharacterized protein n=1 Tax=Centaurea solstitialis TaxID=347529 RepID=A0AA38SRD8_9ASTR|nr:hypothetical protein OSB04_019726 [Centaurea solstitialis]
MVRIVRHPEDLERVGCVVWVYYRLSLAYGVGFELGCAIDPKIETTRATRNLEVKVFIRGGIEDSAMLTSKHSRMLYMERRVGDCLRDGYQERKMLPKPRLLRKQCLKLLEFIVKKIQEVENVYKEYTIGIFEVEFRINLIPNPTESEPSDCGLCRPVGSYPRPKWGIVGRVRRERTNQDGVLSGRDDEKVTAVWVRGIIGLRHGRLDLSGFSADRQVEFEFDVILESASLRRLLIVWRHLVSKSYRVCVCTQRKRLSARVANFGVRHLRVVGKKNESHHMCGDYRELNKVTIKKRYLLPRMDDVLISYKER